MREGRGHVPHLHPSFGTPPQELDLLALECSVRTTAVVPSYSLDVIAHDEVALTEVARHRRARIRRRMLDVRPVDVPARERQIRVDRLARVAGVPDDEAADDEHAVPVEQLDGLRASRCRPSGRPAAPHSSRCARRNARSSSRTFSMPEEHVSEAGARASRAASSSPADEIADVMPWTM